MVDVYLFNPEHDLALAHGAHNYTAPPFARQLRRDLRLLPAWLATAGSFVAIPDDCPVEQDAAWLRDQGLGVTPVHVSGIANLGPCRIHPWGWDAALRYQLLQAGVKPEFLPTDEQLGWIRRLSHRRTTIAIHQALGQVFSPHPVEISSYEGVVDFMAAHPGCYLKMPWSGSGKGIYHVIDPTGDKHVLHWIEGALRRQGALLCEAGLDNLQDFAVECECHGGQTRLTGYSVFSSDFHSQFGRGRVAPMQELHRLISDRYPDVDTVVDSLLRVLDDVIAPHYDGPLGVDMMLYQDGKGGVALNPCVEVNLRMTMGMVTAAMAQQHGRQGQFSITSTRSGTPPAVTYQAVFV